MTTIIILAAATLVVLSVDTIQKRRAYPGNSRGTRLK